MDHIICVVGPTASGKTGLAVQLAQALCGEVVSCDSMQIYQNMTIGTAAPTRQEMQGIRHHMVGIVPPEEDYSVARYVAEADAIVQDILARGKTVILSGGTGLYVDSLIAGRTFSAMPAAGQREELAQMVQAGGIAAVHSFLRQVDPESAARLALADHKRILRAAEVYLQTGKTITQHNLETQQKPPKYHPVWIGLDYADRQVLYERINRRVDLMLEAGLLAEIEALLQSGIPAHCTALQAIGYKEPIAALQGQCKMDEAIAQIKQNSRRYAKRQLTWFRRNKQIHWIHQVPGQSPQEVFDEARRHIPFFDQ